MYSSNPPLGRLWSPIPPYGVAVLSTGVALLLTLWPPLHLNAAPASLLLCSVILSSWFGRVGPGVLAAGLSAIAFYYTFLPPLYAFTAKPAQMPRLGAFLLAALFVGSLGVTQRRALKSLRKARHQLNEAVQKLKSTNEALTKSEAYLLEAQRLCHMGSFGWDVSTGKLFW
jgi:K+-sensing histidine kinase KdpD